MIKKKIDYLQRIKRYVFLGICICMQFSYKTYAQVDVITTSSTNKSIAADKFKLSFDRQKSNKDYNVAAFEKLVLSKKLIEISGLTIDADDEVLYAINDEKAILFQLNQKGEIVSEIDFGKNADFEGLEKVGNHIFILKSNGKIVEFNLLKSEVVEIHNNSLTKTNDTEGLGYDAVTNALLIACKGSPNIKSDSKLKKTKTVYAFDIAAKKLIKHPILSITDEQIEQYMKKKWKGELSKKKYKKKLQRAINFSPSAIAVNPIDGKFYLLSASGKTLIITNRKSKIKSLYFLDDAAYIQPEGICFDGEGNMYISNEGKGLRSNILKISKPN